MAHAGALEAVAHPLRRLGGGIEVADHAAREAAAEVGGFDHDGLDAFARGGHRIHGGHDERSAGHGMEIAGDSRNGERVAAVRRELDLDLGVVEPGVLADVRADRRVFRKNPDAVVLFADAEFAGGAEHAHGHDAAQLGLLDLEVARQDGADRGAGDLDAGAHVRGAADDLERFARAGIHFADVQMVGVLMIAAGEDLGDDYAREGGSHARDLLDFKAGHRERFGKLFGAELRIAILT